MTPCILAVLGTGGDKFALNDEVKITEWGPNKNKLGKIVELLPVQVGFLAQVRSCGWYNIDKLERVEPCLPSSP